MLNKILLIFPPVSKPCEPPASLGTLSGCLLKNNIEYEVLDLNLECFYYLIEKQVEYVNNFEKRAVKNSMRNLKNIKNIDTYKSNDKYRKSVFELNKKIKMGFDNEKFSISFGDFNDLNLNVFSVDDLKLVIEKPELNPFFNYFSKRIDYFINELKCNSIGISMNYLSQAFSSFAVIGYIRKKFKNVKVILGGGLCSSWLQFENFRILCKSLNIEYVKGQGEVKLLEFLNVNKEKQNFEFYPNYDKFKLNKYFSPQIVLPFMAEMGCYYSKCRFCPERAEGNKFKFQKSRVILDKLSYLIEKYNPGIVHFLDNAISPRFLKEIAENERFFNWYGFVRVTKELESLDFCRKLKKSGCIMLQIGIESGSNFILDKMEKGIKIENVQKVLDNLKKAGIKVFAYFLFGTIWENEIEADKTVEFILKNKEKINYLNMAIFNLPKNSPDNVNLETFDFYDGELSLYDNFIHPLGWNRDKVRNYLNIKLKENKEIAKIVNNSPPFFTSNHAPFF